MGSAHCYWHVVVKNGNFIATECSSRMAISDIPPLKLSDEVTKMRCEFKFSDAVLKWAVRYTPLLKWSSHWNPSFQMKCSHSEIPPKISHCYWHVVVKNGNLTLLLTDECEFNFTLLQMVKNGNLPRNCQLWPRWDVSSNFQMQYPNQLSTPPSFKWSSHWDPNFQVKCSDSDIPPHLSDWPRWDVSSNFHWQFRDNCQIYPASFKWSSHSNFQMKCSDSDIHSLYWHLIVKHGNFTLLLTCSGQEWQFHIATDM